MADEIAEIKVASRVRLRSGGPLMTVIALAADGAQCEWFNESGNTQKEWFPLVTLVLQEGIA